jgi:hypothetical protein
MRHAPSSTSGNAGDRRHLDRPREARDDLRSHSLPLGGSDPHHDGVRSLLGPDRHDRPEKRVCERPGDLNEPSPVGDPCRTQISLVTPDQYLVL